MSNHNSSQLKHASIFKCATWLPLLCVAIIGALLHGQDVGVQPASAAPIDLGAPIVERTKEQDAVQDAASLLASGTGPIAVFIKVPSGLGAMASGKGRYKPHNDNPAMAAAAQRAAVLRAMLDAKKNLASLLHGEKISAHAGLLSQSIMIDDSAGNRASSSKVSTESIESVVSGWMTGIVVHAIHDDPQNGTCRVSVITTPATMRAGSAGGMFAPVASSELGIAELVELLNKGTLPPTGCRVMLAKDSGQRVYAGYAIAYADENSARQDANITHAQLACKASLIATLKGESLTSQSISKQEFGSIIGNLTSEDLALLGGTAFKSGAICISSNAETISLATAGKLPMGVSSVQHRREGSKWVYLICAYLEGGVVPAPSIGTLLVPATALQPGLSVPPAAMTRTPDGTAYLVKCKGIGKERGSATKQGLLEALRMVNGAEIASTTSTSKIFMDAVADVEKDFAKVSVEATSVAENVVESTRGLIRKYRVVEEARTAAGLEVLLEVEVPVFDPRNPRPGQRRTIVILPFDKPTMSFVQGDGTVKAAVIDRNAGRQMLSLFVKDARYTVLDRSQLPALDSEITRIERDTANGRMKREESLKLGNALSADIIITGSIENYALREDEKVIELTNERIVRRSLAAKILVVALDVATSEVVGSAEYFVQMGPEDMKKNNLRNPDAALEFVCAEAAEHAYAEISKGLKNAAGRGRADLLKSEPAVVLEVGTPLVLRAPVGALKKKDRLVVARVKTVSDRQGGVVPVRITVATLEVIEVQGAVVLCKVIEGKGEDVKVGDEAVLEVEDDK